MPSSSSYRFLVGVDWATQEHQICVIDSAGEVIQELQVEHSGSEILQFADRLSTLVDGNNSTLAAAIECPRGAIIETLIERGFQVYAINPKQLDRFRDCHTVAGAKDDRRDAYVLADSLRTNQHCFRLLQIDTPSTIQLRELSRLDTILCAEAVRQTNRLREQLHRYYPQMLKLCPNATEPWLWALWELVPESSCVANVQDSQVKEILRRHRIRRISAHEILAVLSEPPLHVAPGTADAARRHLEFLLPQLRLVYQQRQVCAQSIEGLLTQLSEEGSRVTDGVRPSDVEILRSFPGVGKVVCATVFGEASTPLRERDYHNFRALAGIAPVTKQTGKQGKPGSGRRVSVSMRRACSLQLRKAMYHWARVSAQRDESSKRQYSAFRERGHTHGRALRGVADRLLRILFGALRSGTLYQPDFKAKAEGAAGTRQREFVDPQHRVGSAVASS